MNDRAEAAGLPLGADYRYNFLFGSQHSRVHTLLATTQNHRITLTIDNGPDLNETPRILDVLHRQGVTATFFVVGAQADRPGAGVILQRIVDEGHTIGNHTWSHKIPFGENENPEAVRDEVERTSELLAPYLGRPRLFRPFGGGGKLDNGLFSKALIHYLCEHGYSCALWNVVPRDWENPDRWVEVALAEITEKPRSVVVVHDFVRDNAVQIDRFINEARAAGHQFVPELAPDCLPVVNGEIMYDIDAYIGR